MSNFDRHKVDACPFCEPPPDRLISESEAVLALYDGFPVSPGHALVVPRRHVASWNEATPDEKSAIWREVDVVRGLLASRHRPDAFNIGLNDDTVQALAEQGDPALVRAQAVGRGQRVAHHQHAAARACRRLGEQRHGQARGQQEEPPADGTWRYPPAT